MRGVALGSRGDDIGSIGPYLLVSVSAQPSHNVWETGHTFAATAKLALRLPIPVRSIAFATRVFTRSAGQKTPSLDGSAVNRGGAFGGDGQGGGESDEEDGEAHF